MFETVRLVYRNPAWALTNLRSVWAVRKAIKEFRKKPFAKRCWACGGTDGVEIHHETPLQVCKNIEEACDPTKFVVLCRSRGCHLLHGHNGNFKKYYVSNCRAVLAKRDVVEVREIKK